MTDDETKYRWKLIRLLQSNNFLKILIMIYDFQSKNDLVILKSKRK